MLTQPLSAIASSLPRAGVDMDSNNSLNGKGSQPKREIIPFPINNTLGKSWKSVDNRLNHSSFCHFWQNPYVWPRSVVEIEIPPLPRIKEPSEPSSFASQLQQMVKLCKSYPKKRLCFYRISPKHPSTSHDLVLQLHDRHKWKNAPNNWVVFFLSWQQTNPLFYLIDKRRFKELPTWVNQTVCDLVWR